MQVTDDTITLDVGDAKLTLPIKSIVQGILQQALDSTRNATETKPLATASTIPAIGQYWPGEGGINAGLMRGENGQPDYWLIVPTDAAASTKTTWGGYEIDEDDAQSEFDGLANTRALCESDISHPAAEWAAGLVIDGHNDYYLPARRELSLCYANAPELFEKVWHWSSTQYSAYGAWVQYFVDGSQGYLHKGYEYRARAVRRKVIQ